MIKDIDDSNIIFQKYYLVGFLTFGFLPPIADYLHAMVGGYKMAGNARNVWQPFAEAVLSGGDIYVAHWDNKPPLFQFINIFSELTGHYRLVFTLLIGTANFLAAVIIFKLCQRHFSQKTGLVAGLFYLSGGLLFNLIQAINPRQFAVVLILLAFLFSTASARGVSIAAAGLVSQYSVFAIPALIYDDYRRDRLTVRRFITFSIAGLGTVAGIFGIVALVWSPDAAVTGIQYSFFAFGEYTTGYSERGLTFWTNPDRWLYKLYRYGTHLAVITFFTISVIVDWLSGTKTINGFAMTAAVAGGVLLIPSMFRINVWYYLPALPFFAIAGAAALETYFEYSDD